ncbi:MAG: 3-isopropylmalate dehydratase small subunit [Oscillospiraceae bacterium]|jgi:3-isopropylmalate/(R)-2-methylmalate dehydratase small subunit|nr:3-isopropylmalate dehydratase small subunit [Oscillospiraceae bacterium]
MRAIKYGDNVDTDVIIPARYLNMSAPEDLKAHCMEDLDRDFPEKVRGGAIVVGGANFGCGSSREHAPLALKASGVAAVVAGSFARIFYRNAINIGLTIIESPEASAGISDGDDVEVTDGAVRNNTTGAVYPAPPFPQFIKDVIGAGGLLAALKAEG